jgi:hypothetical protein
MVTHDPHAAPYASIVRYLDKGTLLPEGQVPQDWIAAAAPASFQSKPQLGAPPMNDGVRCKVTRRRMRKAQLRRDRAQFLLNFRNHPADFSAAVRPLARS